MTPDSATRYSGSARSVISAVSSSGSVILTTAAAVGHTVRGRVGVPVDRDDLRAEPLERQRQLAAQLTGAEQHHPLGVTLAASARVDRFIGGRVLRSGLRDSVVSLIARQACQMFSRPGRRRSTTARFSPGSTERMTGWPVSWKCAVACWCGLESQQPTCPQVRHIRRCAQVDLTELGAFLALPGRQLARVRRCRSVGQMLAGLAARATRSLRAPRDLASACCPRIGTLTDRGSAEEVRQRAWLTARGAGGVGPAGRAGPSIRRVRRRWRWWSPGWRQAADPRLHRRSSSTRTSCCSCCCRRCCGRRAGELYVALRNNIRPIGLLAVGLPLATTFAVGFVAYQHGAGSDDRGGADARRDRRATGRRLRDRDRPRLGLPRRIMTLLGGESLLNDATALTAYKVALAAAIGAATSWGSGLATFALAAGGGRRDRRRAGRRHRLHSARGSTIRSWRARSGWSRRSSSTWLAEEVHGSGVLAVVVAALILGQRSVPRRLRDSAAGPGRVEGAAAGAWSRSRSC